MAASASPPFVFHARFDDFDSFAESIRGWDLAFRQLDAGRFDGELLQVTTGEIQVAHARFGRVLDQRGAPPAGLRTLVVPADPGQRFEWRGREISGHDLLVFPPGGELRAASRPGFEVFTISLAEEVFAEVAARHQWPEPGAWFRDREVFGCAPEATTALHRRLRAITAKLARHLRHLGEWHLREQLPLALAEPLLATLAAGRAVPFRPAREPRARVLEAVDRLIRAAEDEPLTVLGLCRATGVSERTLRRAFLDRFGVPPKTYLQAVRLNGARRALGRADPAATRVSDVANDFGFWHMGQFAADYRRLFGELPSATLRGRSGGRGP